MLSSHVYWNLYAYAGSSTVLDHELGIKGSRYIEVDEKMVRSPLSNLVLPPDQALQIPTGEISTVAGSPMDFRTPRSIGSQLEQTSGLCGPGAFALELLRVLADEKQDAWATTMRGSTTSMRGRTS